MPDTKKSEEEVTGPDTTQQRIFAEEAGTIKKTKNSRGPTAWELMQEAKRKAAEEKTNDQTQA